jgi:hypothetical protein
VEIGAQAAEIGAALFSGQQSQAVFFLADGRNNRAVGTSTHGNNPGGQAYGALNCPIEPGWLIIVPFRIPAADYSGP